jgi:transposase
MIDALTAEIRNYDRRIETIAHERYPEATVVGQVQGVGSLTALAFVLILEDPRRFETSRTVGAYVGFCPRQSQSGNRDPQLGVTRTGDQLLRRLLINAAHYILGPWGADSDLRRGGLAICARGGKNARKRAIVAVARRLAVLMHRLWVTGEVYEPLRNSTRRELEQPASA